MWENLDKTRPDSVHYSVLRPQDRIDEMDAIKAMFPDAKADELNFVLFSTSGIHGLYATIEECQAEGYSVTFLIVHPRLVCLRYGNVLPRNDEEWEFLKALRKSSHEVMSKIGLAKSD